MGKLALALYSIALPFIVLYSLHDANYTMAWSVLLATALVSLLVSLVTEDI